MRRLYTSLPGPTPPVARSLPAGESAPAAARGEDLAVRREGDAADHRLVGVEASQLLAGPDVPEADGVVPAAGGQRLAVGREGDRVDAALADRLDERVERAAGVARGG